MQDKLDTSFLWCLQDTQQCSNAAAVWGEFFKSYGIGFAHEMETWFQGEPGKYSSDILNLKSMSYWEVSKTVHTI